MRGAGRRAQLEQWWGRARLAHRAGVEAHGDGPAGGHGLSHLATWPPGHLATWPPGGIQLNIEYQLPSTLYTRLKPNKYFPSQPNEG